MKLPLNEFLALHRVGKPAIHPGGAFAVVSVSRLNDAGTKRIAELWRIPLAANAEAALILHGEHGSHQPQFGSDGTLYFLSKEDTEDDSANEVDQVWCLRDGESVRALTDQALGVLDFRVAGNSLIVLAPTKEMKEEPGDQRQVWRDQQKHGPSGRMYTDMNVRSWDHWTGGPPPHFYAYDLDGKGARDLCPSFDKELRADHGLAWDLSRDGSALVSVCLRPGTDRLEDASLLVIEVASAAHKHLGAIDRVTHSSVKFSPNGQRIAAARHLRERAKHGNTRLFVYPRSGGEGVPIASDWDAQPSVEDWHGQDALLVTVDSGGHVPLYRVAINAGEVSRISSNDSGGSHSDVVCQGDKAFGLRHRFEHPAEVFETALQPQSVPALRTWLSGLPKDETLAFETLRCAGAGGTEVQYFFLRADSSVPHRGTILAIHGGPVSAWGDGWHWRWNPLPLLAAGYHVALPNPRGSTGFGQSFIEGVSGNQWGAAAFEDLMAVTDELCRRPEVDETKLVAMGGSFGGYMSNWIGTQTDRFAAIITHASLYRLSAFHGTTDYPAYWAQHMDLDPNTDEVQLDKYSPHRYVDNWKSPVLIIHGERDYRVPISEALMLFEDLRRRDIDAKLLVFPDENHWILKPRNAEQWYRECLLFLDARL